MVLKITSVHSSSQRQMAIKEARLLQKLVHPSIVTVYDHGFRGGDEGSAVSSSAQSVGQQSTSTGHNSLRSSPKSTVQHLILMEYCEGGTAFDAIQADTHTGNHYRNHYVKVPTAPGEPCRG